VITIGVAGDDAVTNRFAGFNERVKERLGEVMERLGVALLDQVRDNLSGTVLQQRSGRLAAAQDWRIDDDGTGLSVAVGFDSGAVPYGAIQEFGGTTRAHLIEAKQAFALSFSYGGQLVFAKRVQHPGSRIPERSFLRAALASMSAEALPLIEATVIGEAQA
jgi:phage gpG-like protein